ncbi:sensor histidine kinase [Larkinella sp. C7]|uniref:sensor histidine kinase n=1 Tax=Larkinella sp. C7 TaxID=2576607 RepID=UPI0011112C1C|nr:sensor histidine kinase [Larkinella sp. C7]
MNITPQWSFRQTHWSAWLHGAIWALYVAVIVYVAAYHGTPVLVSHPSVHLLGQMAIFYLNYGYFIPRFLGRMHLTLFLLFNLGSIFLLEVTTIQLYHSLRAWYLGPIISDFPLSYPNQLVLRFFELVFFVILAGIVRFTGDWFINQRKAKELENVQLRTELAFLKSQLNPHFLFNILNSLYALSLRQAPETSQGIMHLSQLMRYMLYETNEERIILSKEIEIIRRYLDLQKLRLPAHFSIQFDVNGEVGLIRLEPLLLLPIIENIFKHGDDPVGIQVDVTDRFVQMRTVNRLRNRKPESVGGIGLANLRRRLNFLYPNRHQLVLEEREGSFFTTFLVNL